MDLKWSELMSISKVNYKCGYCNVTIGPTLGYVYGYDNYESYTGITNRIYICPNCNNPTHFDQDDMQTPGFLFGNNIQNLPEEIDFLYNEARRCFSINAYNSVAMVTRKILMNVAVNEGATENLNYYDYISYLDESNIIPRNTKKWLDELRIIGNEANHEIKHITSNEAEKCIRFCELLLKIVYEMKV